MTNTVPDPHHGLEPLRSALRSHRPRHLPLAGRLRQAAVAAVLRQREPNRAELLFIRRAEHPRDPWSGHMAFPGGRVDPEDDGPLAAALREAREELDLDLGRDARLLGQLSHVTAIAHGRPLPMVIVPFVFELLHQPAALQPNDEVEEAVWVPLAFLQDRANRSRVRVTIFGVPTPLPAYYFEDRMIWGLTLQMVDELLGLLP